MIKSLKQVSFKFIKANKSITISCITAIAVSIFLITFLMNFSINSENKLKDQTRELFGNFELQIGYDNNVNKDITKSFIDNVNSIKGIDKTSLAIVNNLELNGIRVYTLGLEVDELSKSKYKYSSNLNDNNIIINEVLADSLGLSIGDKINISGREKIVEEIFDDRMNASSPLNMIIMDRKALKEILNTNNEATFIMIKVDGDISSIANEISNLDEGLRVESFEENEFVKENVNTLKYFVIFLAVLVFAMCGIFIVSNLQEYIYKYTKQFALIKAMGGSSFQVFSILIIQTLIMNILGIIAGIGLTFLTVKLFLDSFKFYIFPIALIAALGFIIIQVILLIPGIKTARILPVRAISANEKININHSERFSKVSIIIMIIGLVIDLKCILFYTENNSFIESILGYLLIVVGVLLWMRINMRNILKPLEKPFNLIFGTIGAMSIKTLTSQIKKSSIIILAIAIAMIITSIGGSFTKVLTQNGEDYYKREYLTDIVVSSNVSLNYDKANKLFKDISSLEDVKASMVFQGGTTAYVSDSKNNIEYSLGNFKEMQEQGLIEAFQGAGKSKIIVSKTFAEKNNIKVGEKIRLASPVYENYEGKIEKIKYDLSLEVIEIDGENITDSSDVMIDLSNAELIDIDTSNLRKIYINTGNMNIKEELKEIKKSYPSIKWATLDEVLEESNNAMNERWKYFKAALILIILTTVLGAVNSIKNNINSKRKEYAVLRCMKFTEKDLRKMLMIQIVVFLLIGQVLGAILGYIGSVILASSDGLKIVTPEYTMVSLNIIFSLIISLIYLIPHVRKVSKEKIHEELGREES